MASMTAHPAAFVGAGKQKGLAKNRIVVSLFGLAVVASVLNLVVHNQISRLVTVGEILPFLEHNEPPPKQQSSQETAFQGSQAAKERLNIVLLYPDDMRHDSLGVAGTQIVKTPFLDSLAQESIRFTHNCVTTSICWVSRATLHTGQYFSRHDSFSLKDPNFYKRWSATFPHLLQQEGYYVGHIGKWHYANTSFVEDQFNFTSLFEGEHWMKLENGTTVHATDHSQEEAIRFLQTRPKDAPFHLTVAFYAPKAVGTEEQYFPKNSSLHLYQHETVPEPRVDVNTSFARLPYFFGEKNTARLRYHERFDTPAKYQRLMKNYYRLITEVDSACQRIYQELQSQDLVDRTLIIFTTDNGYFHAEHGLAGKWYPYEESIRVPLIIRDPRMPQDKRGTVDDSFTLNIDLAETILGAAHIPPHPTMQGRDIADLYLATPQNQTPWRREFFYEHPNAGKVVLPASSALVRSDYKYMKFPQYDYELLFDLRRDPLEEHNLANETEYATLLSELRRRHNELEAAVKVPMDAQAARELQEKRRHRRRRPNQEVNGTHT